MLKIVLAQWMNTAFIIYFINNINEAPNEDYISQVRQSLTQAGLFVAVSEAAALVGIVRLSRGSFPLTCVKLSDTSSAGSSGVRVVDGTYRGRRYLQGKPRELCMGSQQTPQKPTASYEHM